MTQTLERILERASRLPAAVQERLAHRWLKDIEQQAATEEAAPEDEQPFVSAYDLAKDLLGSIDSGTPDLATNKKHMEGFGESSMR
ncbi:MAG: hypothetical protein ACR2GR_08460 [Rhodothermales bacterium]